MPCLVDIHRRPVFFGTEIEEGGGEEVGGGTGRRKGRRNCGQDVKEERKEDKKVNSYISVCNFYFIITEPTPTCYLQIEIRNMFEK